MTREELEQRRQDLLAYRQELENAVRAVLSGAQIYELPDGTKVTRGNLFGLNQELERVDRELKWIDTELQRMALGYNTRVYVKFT